MLSSVEEASLEFSEFAESSSAEANYEYSRRFPYGMQQRQAAGREADYNEFKLDERKVAREDLRGGDGHGIGKAKMEKKKHTKVRIPEDFSPVTAAGDAKSREDLSRKKDRKKKHKKSKKGTKLSQSKSSIKKTSKKLANLKRSLRPETRKAATKSDPTILEANWPTLDVLVIFQLFNAFFCLLYAIISAALGEGTDAWAFFFFALMLLVTSVPSFVLIAKAAVESAIVVYSVLQLVSTFFGLVCVTAYFIKESQKEDGAEVGNNLGKNIFLLVNINLQLLTTFFINWKPYRRVNLKKVREAFADLKDGGKSGGDEEEAQEGEGINKEESGITSALTSTTKSNYRFYN